MLKVDALQPQTLWVASLVSIGYAGLLLVEGVGLWIEVAWAAYLTVSSTALFLPFEVYEVLQHVSMLRMMVLLVNLAIVIYPLIQLKRLVLHAQGPAPRHAATYPEKGSQSASRLD